METLQRLFAQWAGEPLDECLPLGGGGSSRRYFRMRSVSHSCIGTVGQELRENQAFFAYSNYFGQQGLPVPEVYAVAADELHYLQQDLGDQSLYGLLYQKKRAGGGFDAEMLSLYRRALADLHALQVAGRGIDFSVGYPRGAFDRRAIMWDLNYFKYYFLRLQHIPFDEEKLENDFQAFADHLLQADCSYFVYRDFQGRNIMLTPQLQAPLHYIDYQGARRGAAQYDVASLLYSAKSDLPDAVRRDLLGYYASLHGDENFEQYFWPWLLLRILQTLGAYGYRGLYERKPYFMESIPYALHNLRQLVDEHPLAVELPELQRCIAAVCRLQAQSTETAEGVLTVQVMSFSYKQGLPTDPSGNGGGHVFDCRALPNPGRYEQYRAYTGRDASVVQFLQAEPAVGNFLQHAEAIVDSSVEKYVERRFTHLQVSFGCTGGQHRSVYCAEQMAKHLRVKYADKIHVILNHREQD